MAKVNKIINIGIWNALVLITVSAVVLINQFSPFVPDYDGLGYFNIAKTINGWLFLSSDDYRIWNNFAASFVSFWPITNALSVFIVAIFYHTIDINLLPALINSFYLLLFATYLKKIKPPAYVYMAILLLCGHTLFFRLFTTLTSEFSVGLWIFSFLLTLISNHERRGIYLAVLSILGLLLRTVDVVFVLMAASAYVAIHYSLWRDRRHIFTTLRYIGLSLLLSAPIFFQHYKVAFEYVYNVSFGVTSASWKSLGGVADRYDVIVQYAKLLFLYNPLVVPGIVLTLAMSFYFKVIEKKLIALIVGISLAVCLPLLMASSLNIQVVFWVYASLIFIVCELGFPIFCGLSEKLSRPSLGIDVKKNIILTLISLGSIFFLSRSWSYEIPYLRQQAALSEIAFDISKVLNTEQGVPTVASNYRGVGALDILGLAWRRESNYSYGGIGDIYSKNKNPNEYLELQKSTNFFIAAHENYFFAPHFGINDHIRETYRLFSEKSSELGFKKIEKISRKGKNFDIWYRPVAQAYPQYASFNDTWISWRMPLEIGVEKLCAGDRVSGVLDLSISFQNPNLPTFAPPFLITVRKQNSTDALSSSIVKNYGVVDTSFNLKNIDCGKYELSIDKAFSTKADPRELSAQFVKLESAFKFDIKQMSK